MDGVAGFDPARGILFPSFHTVERAGEFHRGAADGADIDGVRRKPVVRRVAAGDVGCL